MSTYTATMMNLMSGCDLARPQAEELMQQCLAGDLEPAQVAAWLTALTLKGVTVDELTGFVAAMREAAAPLPLGTTTPGDLMDTCGTGGSGLPTTNTSTLCAFVLAAAGVPVVKHGNRASTGRCGSMDVLEELGVAIEFGPSRAATLLAGTGIALLFAPRFHPAMRHVAPVRRALGFRTVFNFLGPLCNPAGSCRQLLGVSDAAMAPRMASVLAELGCPRALVVRGEDGLDELSLSAPTRTWEVVDGELREGRLDPRDVGLGPAPFEAVAGGDRADNARRFMAVLRGEERGPLADHLSLNAGAALAVAGRVGDVAEGVAMARALLDSGAALARFEAYRDATRALAAAA